MTPRKRKLTAVLAIFILTLTIFATNTSAKKNEYDAVCDHLKQNYQAKKVKIPFMWMARVLVGVVRPAGVKSFKVTIFKNLQFSPESLNDEMKTVMSDAFSEDWTPILRVRSAAGNQVYMNMRESGDNIKILLVSIEKSDAVVVRAKFDPEKLVEFVENPKIFGISINSEDSNTEPSKPVLTESKENKPEAIKPEEN